MWLVFYNFTFCMMNIKYLKDKITFTEYSAYMIMHTKGGGGVTQGNVVRSSDAFRSRLD